MRARQKQRREPELNAFAPTDPDADADMRACERPGCRASGEFRAPRSPRELDVYLWFCKEHIREYNKSWNFYANMGEAEVEADVRRDTVWRRASWPLGVRNGTAGFRISDGFGYFNEAPRRKDPIPPRRETAEELALGVLDLESPVTAATVKARYKELVKRHHPDANGGTKASEEKFKEIALAYRTVLDSLDS